MAGLARLALPFLAGWLAGSATRHRGQIGTERRATRAAGQPPADGLAGRAGLKALLKQRLDGQRTGEGALALIAVELGGLAEANSAHGPAMGDRLSGRAADRLRATLREGDALFAIDCASFAVVLAGAADADEAAGVAARLVERLARPFLLDGQSLYLTPAAGVALAPGDGAEPDLLWRNALVALDDVRGTDGAGWKLYRREMHERLIESRRLAADLRRAIVRRDLKLMFQPQQCSRTGVWKGAEALVRWTHPERGPISPAEFIPLAEQLGLIGALGDWVLATACRAAAGWPPPMSVAVNLSARQLEDPGLAGRLAEILRKTGLEPHRLELELTETALMRDETLALERLSGLATLGVRLALDDFGTGYSSLSTLHRFPFQRVKIDRSFVMRLPSDDAGSGIVRAIAALGGELGLSVTAEGVETEVQRRLMTEIGCDELQGYLLARPMAGEAVAELFAEPARLAG